MRTVGAGVAAVVHTFGGGHKGRSTGADGDASKAGVEVRCMYGEHGFILRHLECLAPADIHVRYKCGSWMRTE